MAGIAFMKKLVALFLALGLLVAAAHAQDASSGTVTLKITAVGDCTFCGEAGSKSNKRFLECVQENGYDYFFANVRDLFEADDLTIVNLEGPLTTAEKPRKHGYVFKADPACVQILTGSSVELCNLANNHSMDYGVAGLKQTAEVLAENGIGYCGFTEAWSAELKGVKVTALGFTKWDHTVEQVTESVARARAGCDLLIVNLHWGWERQNQQCHEQVEMGHAAIDAGADLVIGTHPHVYQGIEKYRGKYIVYSLGNFDNLVAAFYRTRACNKSKVSATNFYTANINNSIFRMELSVCLFIWFTDSCNRFNNIKSLEQVNINLCCITNQSKNGFIITFRKMNLKSLFLKPFNQIVNLFLTYTRF